MDTHAIVTMITNRKETLQRQHKVLSTSIHKDYETMAKLMFGIQLCDEFIRTIEQLTEEEQ